MNIHVRPLPVQLIYTLRRSHRARRVRLSISPDGSIVATVPFGTDDRVAERFVRQKSTWLRKKILFFREHQAAPMVQHTCQEYLKEKERARIAVTATVEQYSAAFGFRYNLITIRQQKTCWGSCSRKKNLSFNYRIMSLPENIREYIVVHELCHLQEFNHSPKFWTLVSQVIPDFRQRKLELRRYRIS